MKDKLKEEFKRACDHINGGYYEEEHISVCYIQYHGMLLELHSGNTLNGYSPNGTLGIGDVKEFKCRDTDIITGKREPVIEIVGHDSKVFIGKSDVHYLSV